MKFTKFISLFMLTYLAPVLCAAENPESKGWFASLTKFHWFFIVLVIVLIGYAIYRYMSKK